MTTPQPTPRVSAIVLTYNGELDMVRDCVSAIAADPACSEIIVVDNGSADHGAVAAAACAQHDIARTLLLSHNGGFSVGINAGVAVATGDYLWIINNDATPEPDALSRCVERLAARPDLAGVAPLLVFADRPQVIDAFGNAIDPHGAAFNVGIGQIDVGQFMDRPIFGPCFAAALLRRAAWELIGPLDERYFLYFEDVEWNWRAGLLGYTFEGVANARVRHVHSASSRHLAHDFKYRLIQRNLLVTLVKVAERPWLRVARRCGALARNVVRRHYPGASARALLGFVRLLPHALVARRGLQRRRITPDRALIGLGAGERPFIDPVTYRPVVAPEALAAMYSPLAPHNSRASEIVDLARRLSADDAEHTMARLRELVAPDGPEISRYVEDLAAAPMPPAGV